MNGVSAIAAAVRSVAATGSSGVAEPSPESEITAKRLKLAAKTPRADTAYSDPAEVAHASSA
eukprot:7194203-Alexandrium_andersonii.AAC.1